MKEVNFPEQLVTFLKEAKIDGLPKEWLENNTFDSEIVENEEMAKQLKLKPQENIVTEESSLNWIELREKAEKCVKCRLCDGRNKVVFGSGNIKAKLVFIGEGPGAEEDKTGEPFVGRAGQLLTAAIEKGMGLTRDDVYICNVVKCRPPQNRAPLPDETEACTPYLYRQLELISPQVIVTLGQPAQMATCGVNIGITKLRGQWQDWRGFKVLPTFHPAYLLRNPPMKKFFWEDLQTVMKELGITPPPKSE